MLKYKANLAFCLHEKALFMLKVYANAFKMAFICLKYFKNLNFQHFSHFLKKNN